MIPAQFPALSEKSSIRYILFASLYAAQGLTPGLMTIAFPAWMVEQGLSASQIGVFLGITSISWSLKFVLGPLMDRFGYLPMGKNGGPGLSPLWAGF